MKRWRLIPMLFVALGAALNAFADAPTLRVTQLFGKPVVDASGAPIGEVDDVVVDTSEGRVAFTVISVGVRLVAIPLPSPELSIDAGRVVLAMGRGRLDAMPTFDAAAAAPRLRRAREILAADLKDRQGADIGDVKDLVIGLVDGKIASVVVAFDPKWYDKEGWVALPRQSVRHEGRDFVANFNREDMRPASQAQAEQRRADEVRAAAASVDRDERASQLIGRTLVDAQGRPVGEIADLAVDPRTGRIAHALVAAAGGGLAALPLPAKDLTRNGDRLVLASGAAGLTAASPDGNLRRASGLMKASLADFKGKEVGGVRDLVVNLGAGKVRYAVAEFDPSWVLAGKLVAVKFSSGEPMRVELNDLMGAMVFDKGGWPDLNNPQYRANIDHYLERR